MRYAVMLLCLLALGACDQDDPQSSSAYNTVTTDSLTPKIATLREYWQNGAGREDEIRYYRTGRYLSFQFPEAYYYFGQDVDGRDGVSKVMVRWDAKTGGPITRSVEARMGVEERRAREIEVVLSHYNRVQHPVSPNDLRDGANLIERPTGARDPRPQSDDPPPFRALGETYCGFDMYGISPRAQDSYREHDGHERLQAPFDRAEMFARKNRDGQYDTVIACEATPSAGWCRVATDFRGWPMMLLFSGKNLCAFDRIIEQSRALLAAHLAATSPRTQQPPAGARLIPAIDDVPRRH